MTPLCKVEVILAWVLGSPEVRRAGGVHGQARIHTTRRICHESGRRVCAASFDAKAEDWLNLRSNWDRSIVTSAVPARVESQANDDNNGF
jgi:hypothetical protein